MRLLCTFTALLVLIACSKSSKTNEEALAPPPPGITPVPLPNPNIPGFVFPENEETINKWVQANDTKLMAQHAWGIWTALTTRSGVKISGEDMLVYETWTTPAEVKSIIQSPPDETVNTFMLEQAPKRKRQKLSKPRQFEHEGQEEAMSLSAQSVNPLVAVSYDPKAAEFIVSNKLYRTSVLSALLNQGKTDIPDFPSDAIALKPVYQIIPGLKRATELFQLKVWTQTTQEAKAYPPDAWPGCVYIDVNNKGRGKTDFDNNCKGAVPETTYNLSDFIYYTLTQDDVENIGNGFDAQVGDIALLIAMHVTTREIKRWTWSTFWWSPNPDSPPLPSSKLIADNRPAALVNGARHYSLSIGNTFIIPDQPLMGGSNKGTSHYAFNPYLEAGFGGFRGFREVAKVKTGNALIVNNVGVRTNCMSCHAQANFTIMAGAPGYIGDTYVDMSDKKFKNRLRVDFLWSIVEPRNIIKDN